MLNKRTKKICTYMYLFIFFLEKLNKMSPGLALSDLQMNLIHCLLMI